jgi:hypothetical protein
LGARETVDAQDRNPGAVGPFGGQPGPGGHGVVLREHNIDPLARRKNGGEHVFGLVLQPVGFDALPGQYVGAVGQAFAKA